MNAEQIKLGLEDAVEILTVSQSLKLDRAIEAVKSIPQTKQKL